MLTREYFEALQSERTVPEWEAFYARLAEFTPSEDTIRAIRIQWGVHDYDPRRVPSDGSAGCECPRCQGLTASEDACLYRDINPQGRLLSSLDPDLLRRFWDLPVTLYLLALEHRACEIRHRRWHAKDANGCSLASEARGGATRAAMAAMDRIRPTQKQQR